MFSFDGKTKKYIASVEAVESHYGPNREVELINVKGRRGAVQGLIDTKEKQFKVTFIIKGKDRHELQKNADDMVLWLTTDTARKLVLPDDPNRYYEAIVTGPIDKDSIVNFSRVTVTFVSLDGLGYSSRTFQNTAISDAVSVVNEGTADTNFRVEATAFKDSTMFLISKNDDDYFMIGESESANKDKVITEPYLFDEEFTSLSVAKWTRITDGTTLGGNLDGGDVNGGRFAMVNTGESITVENFGTAGTTGWHGAGLFRSLEKSLQDFRIRFKVLLRQGVETGTGKAMTYVLDESSRPVFSIGYVNTSNNTNTGSIVVYAYNEFGEAKRIYRYETPLRYNKVRNLQVYMTIERKGKRIYIKTWKYDGSSDPKRLRPIDESIQTYNDAGGNYQNPVRILRMYQGKSSKFTNHLHINILGYSIQELKKTSAEVTPVIIKSGDIIVIDTKGNYVTINGEMRTDIKDFGSNYFKLPAGLTHLLISPENTFDTKVTWNDRYL